MPKSVKSRQYLNFKIMKRFLFLSVAFLMIATVSFAQSDKKFGIKAGTTFGEGDISFLAGGFARFQVSEKLAFQPELLYSMDKDKESIAGIDVEMTLNFISLPLLMKYYIIEGFSVNAGPYVGYLISDDITLSSGGHSASTSMELEKIEVGASFGLGYELVNGIGVDARYNLGLTEIMPGTKRGLIQVALSYAF